jgi:metal-dependent amidase/aminoacylase/carboxypeptidase family protein
MRSYSAVTRRRMLDAIGRIVRAECQASGSPKDPEFETIVTFPVTDNDAAAIGFTDKQAYLAAEKAGTLDDLPTNHSPAFLPPLQPTLRTGTEALVAAALAWLAPH